MGRLFGTDGVRGVANKELTAQLAFKLGQAGAYVLSGGGNKKAKILIGKDTRKSSDMLEAAIVAGVCSVGADAIVIGTAPTPAIAYITRTRGYDAGIVISASHNPFEFNGIKFFSSKGYKLNDDIEAEIESIILDGKPEMTLPVGEGLGNVTYDFDAKREYMDFAKSTIDVDFKGMTIAIDCANGASSVTSEYVLRELGADVRVINNKPDGININTNCGSTHIEGLCEFVKEQKADLGLAFDGDADRVLAVDENGVLVDGDKIMTICGLFMRDEGKLKKDTIVATVMSNLGFFIMAEKNNLNTAQTKVGDRYVLEEMLKEGYSLGGEQSGHIIFLDHNTTGDGLADEGSLRGSSEIVAERIRNEIQERVSDAGIEIIEARITYLAYAPEIAAVMLQRQQASAIIDARRMIVDGAVGMVEMALERLQEGGMVELDDERKAAMVSNLLVVLCGNRDAQPVVNSGSLY